MIHRQVEFAPCKRGKYSPAVAPGVRFWVRAADLVLAGGVNLDPVAAWPEKILANNLGQATAAKKPTLITAGMNGFACVRFDGVDDVLISLANVIPAAYRDTPLTICASLTPQGGAAGEVVSQVCAGFDYLWALGRATATTQFNSFGCRIGGAESAVCYGPASAVGTPVVVSVVFDGGGVQTFVNGVAGAYAAMAGPNWGGQRNNLLSVGGTPYNGGFIDPARVDVGNIVICALALDATSRGKLETWLRADSGI